VEVRAAPGLYEPRGEFQLNVEFMRRAGLGVLFERFAKLKLRLETEGLFAPERKKPVPRFARRVGVVTSTAAAALRDVLTTLKRRMPSIPVTIYPTPVQGEGAAQQIAAAIETAGRRAECDVLILCRGGGSIEDLWAFNEEVVARAIASCALPVVCGVGHETDYTIADFVADVRAPTPTGAAELVSPNRSELQAQVAAVQARLTRSGWRLLERRMQQVDFLARRITHPGERIASQQRHLAQVGARLIAAIGRAHDGQGWKLTHLGQRLASASPRIADLHAKCVQLRTRLTLAAAHRLERHVSSLERLRSHLTHLDPQRVLTRGYAIVRREDGAIVRRAQELSAGAQLDITLGDGGADAIVTRVKP
jgi:exodeoxyribonuclease VII large subunit